MIITDNNIELGRDTDIVETLYEPYPEFYLINNLAYCMLWDS